MLDFCILFTYHGDDQVTRPHHDLIRRLNPGVPVIPLVDGRPGIPPRRRQRGDPAAPTPAEDVAEGPEHPPDPATREEGPQ